MPAPFSRLQLAAALIEYDNDLEDPEKPQRSAQESAIFLPFRNRPLGPPAPERRSTDYLGVALPSETGSIAPRESLAFDRRSRASIDALRNPFARESTYEGGLEDEDEEDLEVDLASWGLDALVSKEKPKHSRKKTKSDALPNPYEQSVPVREVGKPHTRAMSVNMLNGLGDGGAFLDSQSISPPLLGPRRHSIGDPLDLPTSHSAEAMFPPRSRSRSPSAHALIDNITLQSPLYSVPFPTSETVRSPSPQVDGAERARAQSSLSVGSRALLNDDVRSASPGSRLDLRTARGRTYSSGSMSNMLAGEPQADEDNPFAVRPPSPSRMSRFDPKAQRARTVSQGTMATQMMLDDAPPEARPPLDRRYSRMELMRPKVLIMPSPLQSQLASSSQSVMQAREGFELSTDGRPLPPGARAARRASSTLSVLEPGLNAGPVASNSFTPNPRSSLTLSQLVFRNTLLVGGERDVAYADIEGHLKRATEDGEQVQPEPEPEPELAREVPIVQVDEPGQKRPAGKLYGRSLIDDLEARKAEMRGKQRVFRGDERPSMMARSSTLINPDELKRPTSQHLASFTSQPNLARRNSVNAKPLLEFEEEVPGAPRKSVLLPGGAAGGNTRSVFGVDTIWQRELAKLKIIEEQERQAEAERKLREAAEEAKGVKKKGKKKKGKGRDGDEPSPALTGAETLSPAPDASPAMSGERPPTPPHVLPEIPKTVRRRPPPPADDEDESDEESDDSDGPAPPRRAQPQTSGWHSDEEEEGPRRTTGTGPRYPQSGPPRLPQIVPQADESSEEDVPLVATIGRAAQRQTRLRSAADDSSDEDKPLTALLDKTKQKLPSLGGSQLSPTSLRPRPATDEDEDEDDVPLGLRASRIPPGFAAGGGGDDDDDKPLGMHPEQLRKSQFFMAAQQQQQQQMLAQAQMAQMQHAMMYATPPSMMGSGYFGPPMPPPMMMYPQLPPTPPPIQDKLGRVDKWRHDVAVEGERS